MEQPFFFPVRHHLPIAAHWLLDYLERARPESILFECPKDAQPFLESIVHPECEPPLALLAIENKRSARQFFMPFVAYSPEYVALKWAFENGVPIHAIDVPAIEFMADHEESSEFQRSYFDNFFQGLCYYGRTGDFQELEEKYFHLSQMDSPSYLDYMNSYSEENFKNTAGHRDHETRLREAFMAHEVAAHIQNGCDPGKMVVILGAAHVFPVREREVDTTLLEKIDHESPVLYYLIPNSYYQFSPFSGYRAGVKYPHYFQILWNNQCDLSQANSEMLATVAAFFKKKEFEIPPSDLIDAQFLMTNLANLRGKPEPGSLELFDSLEVTLSRFNFKTHINEIQRLFIGEKEGRVKRELTLTPLLREFFYFFSSRNPLNYSMGKSEVKVVLQERHQGTIILNDLIKRNQQQLSIYYHRLVFLGIPFLTLDRFKFSDSIMERWVYDFNEQKITIAFINKAKYGDSIETASESYLREILERSPGICELCQLLMYAVKAYLPDLCPVIIHEIKSMNTNESKLEVLISSIQIYIQARQFAPLRELEMAPFEELLETLIKKSIYSLELNLKCGDDRLETVFESVLRLDYYVRVYAKEFVTIWEDKILNLNKDQAGFQPKLVGLLYSLLYSRALILSDEIVDVFITNMTTMDPQFLVDFLDGLFHFSSEFIETDSFLSCLNGYLSRLDEGRFLAILPFLRKTFTSFPEKEKKGLAIRVKELSHSGGHRGHSLSNILNHRDYNSFLAVYKGSIDTMLHLNREIFCDN